MHQSIPAAPSPPTPPPPPGLLRGICQPCRSWGWGISKVRVVQAPGICQPQAFDAHAVSYQNNIMTTQRILLGKKANWLICQGQEKIEEGCKGMFFFVCISSLLIKPELHSKIGSYRCESTFFGNWIKFLLILFEKIVKPRGQPGGRALGAAGIGWCIIEKLHPESTQQIAFQITDIWFPCRL